MQVVPGEALHHVLQLRLDLVVAPQLVEHPQPLHVKHLGVRRLGNGRVDGRQRAGPVLLAQQVGDHHPAGDGQVRALLEQRLGDLHRQIGDRLVLVAQRVAVIQPGAHRLDHRILGGQLFGDLQMARGLVPVVQLGRKPGQRPAALEVLGILLDQAQILADGGADIAAALLDLRIGQPRALVIAVELEDVAELDQRPVDLALLDQGQALLVMLLGALLGGIAGRKQPEAQQDGHQDGEVSDHVLVSEYVKNGPRIREASPYTRGRTLQWPVQRSTAPTVLTRIDRSVFSDRLS